MTLERENGVVLTFSVVLLTNFGWFVFPFFRSINIIVYDINNEIFKLYV